MTTKAKSVKKKKKVIEKRRVPLANETVKVLRTTGKTYERKTNIVYKRPDGNWKAPAKSDYEPIYDPTAWDYWDDEGYGTYADYPLVVSSLEKADEFAIEDFYNDMCNGEMSWNALTPEAIDEAVDFIWGMYGDDGVEFLEDLIYQDQEYWRLENEERMENEAARFQPVDNPPGKPYAKMSERELATYRALKGLR